MVILRFSREREEVWSDEDQDEQGCEHTGGCRCKAEDEQEVPREAGLWFSIPVVGLLPIERNDAHGHDADCEDDHMAYQSRVALMVLGQDLLNEMLCRQKAEDERQQAGYQHACDTTRGESVLAGSGRGLQQLSHAIGAPNVLLCLIAVLH